VLEADRKGTSEWRTEYESIAATTLLSMAATTRGNDEAVRALNTDAGAELREEDDVEAQDRELRKRLDVRERRATIPRGSFLTAEGAARAYNGWAATTSGLAPNLPAGYEGDSARASRQRATLTTRPCAHARGLPQQCDDEDEDEAEQLTDSDGSEADDYGDGVMSSEPVGRDTAQPKAPAAEIARRGKADCAQYIGVTFDERRIAFLFEARIYFKSKLRRICRCPTAEAAARAYDAVACLIPGRKLNFPTTIPAAATSSRQQRGVGAVPPAERDVLAAIAAVREAQPQYQGVGAVKYFGVSINNRSASYPYRVGIRMHGKVKHLGYHSTAEAAARAYDAVASTIPGHKLNFPTGGSSAAAAAGGSRRSQLARGACQTSRPQLVAHDDDGSAAAPAASAACARKRKQPSSSSLPRAGAASQRPTRQRHLCPN
jgi:hypothetical protein